jgi:quercetin dioxygenase-like cupin family protein
MVEMVYRMDSTQKVQRLLLDDHLQAIHMCFAFDEGLPPHNANSNVYMTVIRGCLSIGLNDQPVVEYPAQTLLKIPEGTRMNVKNLHAEPLELLVFKAPAPKMS